MFYFKLNTPNLDAMAKDVMFSVGFSSWEGELPFMHNDRVPRQEISLIMVGYYGKSTVAAVVHSSALFRNRYTRLTLVLMVFKDSKTWRSIEFDIKNYHNHNMPFNDITHNYQLSPD